MERWNRNLGRHKENKRVDEFIEEVLVLCKKRGFSIGHEDGHGAFEIETFSEYNAEWLRSAADAT